MFMLNNYAEPPIYTEHAIVENYSYGNVNNNGTHTLFENYFSQYIIKETNSKSEILDIFNLEKYLDDNDNKAINDIILGMAVEHKKSIFDYYD